MFQRDSGLSYYMCEIGWFVVVDGCVLAWICWMFIVVLLVLVCLAFGCELVGGGGGGWLFGNYVCLFCGEFLVLEGFCCGLVGFCGFLGLWIMTLSYFWNDVFSWGGCFVV